MTLFYDDELAEARAHADIVDLFAGPGGWSEACRELGTADIGIELDRWACATRRAAGHATVEANVAHIDPADYLDARGLIASPPCPAFSNAGNKLGRRYLDQLTIAIASGDWQARPHHDPDIWLSLEVGRWAETLRPEWVALEQVPAVLPLWHAYAQWFADHGYHVWTGKLNAADYGVPQTRERAILMAHRRPFDPPNPTHARDGADGLTPWVTMAEALGIAEPFLVGFPRLDDRGDSPHGYRERDLFSSDGPAPTVTEKARSWMLNTGRDWKPGGSRDDAQTIDCETSPAPALTAKSGGQWQLVAGGHENSTRRNLDEPAPTLAFGHAAADWRFERPATTIAGDPRVWPPGHKINQDDRDRLGDDEAQARYGDRAGTDAIRITPRDALILQSFRPDYPVRGGLTKQHEQIGNAIPPRLAWHILNRLLKL